MCDFGCGNVSKYVFGGGACSKCYSRHGTVEKYLQTRKLFHMLFLNMETIPCAISYVEANFLCDFRRKNKFQVRLLEAEANSKLGATRGSKNIDKNWKIPSRANLKNKTLV